MFFILWTGPLFSQISGNYDFSFLSQEDGLSSDFVLSFYEDHQGFIWIGSENGVNRYDGYQFSDFRDDPNNENSLKGNFVRMMIEDKNLDIWISTDKALNILRRKTGNFEIIPLEEMPHLPKGISVNFLQEDLDGNIWAGTISHGVLKINYLEDESKWQVERYHFQEGNKYSIPNGIIRSIIKDKNHNIWIATSLSICKYSPQTNNFEVVHLNDLIDTSDNLENIQGFNIDHKNGLVVGTHRGGIIQLIDAQTDISKLKIKRFLNANANETDPFQIKHSILGKNGTIWISSNKGIIHLDLESGEYELINDLPNVSSYPPNRLADLFMDSKGKLWAATNGNGLTILKKSLPIFDYYSSTLDLPQSLSGSQVRSMLIDQKDNLWVATLGDGLDVFRLSSNGKWEKTKNYRNDPNDSNSLVGNNIIKIIEDQAGNIWIATNGNGLSKLNPDTEQFTNFVHDPKNPKKTISNDRLWALCEDNDGIIWAGTFEFGINLINPKSGEIKQYLADAPNAPPGLSNNLIRTIYKDSKGQIWVGTEGGLSRYDKAEHKFISYYYSPVNPNSLTANWVWTIFEDSAGDYWVGTNLGLNKFDPETGNSSHYFEQDGLPSNSIYGILEDNNGQLWVSTDVGLVRFIKDEKKQKELGLKTPFRIYYPSDGLMGDAFLPHSFLKDHQTGNLYFGGTHGFNIIKPDQLRIDTTQPSIILSNFSRLDKATSFNVQFQDPFIADKKNITIHPSENVFSFTFTDFLSDQDQGNQYEYLLEGLSNQWIPLKGEKDMTFLQIASGLYTLKIKGINADGYTIKEQELIDIRIQTPWWKSYWAVLVYFILLLSIFIFLRQSELHRTKLRQEAAIERARAEEKVAQAETVALQAKRLQESLNSLQIKNQEIIATQNQLILKEKMASLGQITAGIAHEIKNPLNFVTNFAEGSVELVQDLEELVNDEKEQLPEAFKNEIRLLIDDLKQNAKDIQSNGIRADRIVKSMMQHARGKKEHKISTDMNALIEENINLAYHGYRALEPSFHVQINKELSEKLPTLQIIQQDIGRVLLNLLNNACYAVHNKQKILTEDYIPAISVSSQRVDHYVKISIHDNGIGIPQEVKEKIFTPFFTTKPTGTGNTGLGLSISFDIIVKGHQGKLEVESTPNNFTCFHIFLPF